MTYPINPFTATLVLEPVGILSDRPCEIAAGITVIIAGIKELQSEHFHLFGRDSPHSTDMGLCKSK